MAVKDKDTLKTYFETGDNPTQDQFEDLIDSLKQQGETGGSLDKQQLIQMLNSMAVENGYVAYNTVNIGNTKVLLEVAQQNVPNQLIALNEMTYYDTERQYFAGDAPYTIRLKEFQGEKLSTNEYYFSYWEINPNYSMQRLSGNTLPDMTEGFEFGTPDKRKFYIQILKQDMGQQIKIVYTHIQFTNSTDTAIAYRAESRYWGDRYKTEDSTTDHYNAWDYLYFYFNADMVNATQSIVCNIYNNDNGQLVQTTSLQPGQNYQNVSGGQVNGVRNVRIECKKS